MLEANTLIVSDIHLGSNYSRVDELLFILHSWKYDRLILLGDIFESLNLKRFSAGQLEFVSFIRNLTSNTEVVWVEGNHDEGVNKIVPFVLGIKVCKEYQWEYNGEKYLAIHGNQFDYIVKNSGKMMNFVYYLHTLIQDLEYNTNKVSKYLLQKSSSWANLSDKVARYAIQYASKSGSKNIFCGHTHKTMSLTSNDINYYNTGSWTDSPSGYISICNEGIKIHEVH